MSEVMHKRDGSSTISMIEVPDKQRSRLKSQKIGDKAGKFGISNRRDMGCDTRYTANSKEFVIFNGGMGREYKSGLETGFIKIGGFVKNVGTHVNTAALASGSEHDREGDSTNKIPAE